ncbi:peptidylprolyl isomerase [Cohnella nanjingensis]|uniref:Foldase protein PrsA n=1 Tax=Cohnella nanjingensis TaxID=1387779 RepID=A0A7X0RXG4_9BACL|nr:peptidylprolyl isomerase [Cohnella nanjingensis]MBB6675433.1 peptidylprolyl isomerase [Cohnella nanjingensis]
MSDLEKDPKNPASSEPEETTETATDKLEEQAADKLPEPEFETATELSSDEHSDNAAAVVPASEAQPAKPASAVVPWVIAIIAVVALAVVLVRGTSGGGMNEAVGKLDGKDITKAELYDEMVKQSGKEQVGSLLDNYMTLKLIKIEADKAGAKVSDADIDKELAKIKEKNGFTSDAQLESALAGSGMSLESFREQIQTQVELRAVFEKQSAPKDDDLKAYYEKNKANFGTVEEVKASHILLKTKAEAEDVLKQLKNGGDFAKLAQEKSTDPGSKDNGGDLGFFPKGQMNEQFETAAFNLKKGELSGVVESPNGFHIIKVTDRKEAVVPTYEDVKDEVKSAYLDEKINEGASEWIQKAKKDTGYKNLLTDTPEPSASPAASEPASPAVSASPAAK